MSLREINYNINTDGISPGVEQFGGTQGDHRVTKLNFVFSNKFHQEIVELGAEGDKVMYRFDVYDGEGGIWSSEPKKLEGYTLSMELEERHTRHGGKVTIYLVLTVLSSDCETEIELYSFPAVLRLKNRQEGTYQDGENYESILGLAEITKQKATEASASALAAEKTKKELQKIAATVEEKLANGEFDGKDGVSVTHSFDGTVLKMTSASGTTEVDLKGAKGEQGIKGEKGDMPDMSNYYTKGEVNNLACVRNTYEEAEYFSINAPNQNQYIDLYNDDDIDINADGHNIDINGAKIVCVATPEDDTDAATKGYVDDAVANVGGGGSTETWEVISDTTTEFDNPVSQIVINQDTNGNSFSLKKMKVFIDFTVAEAYTGYVRALTTKVSTANFMYIISQTFSAGTVYGYIIESEVLPMVNNRCSIISRFSDNRMIEVGNNFDFNYNTGAADYGIRNQRRTVTTLPDNVSSISSFDFRLAENGKINKARILILGVKS